MHTRTPFWLVFISSYLHVKGGHINGPGKGCRTEHIWINRISLRFVSLTFVYHRGNAPVQGLSSLRAWRVSGCASGNYRATRKAGRSTMWRDAPRSEWARFRGKRAIIMEDPLAFMPSQKGGRSTVFRGLRGCEACLSPANVS